ncbi:MAG: hypothetical protein IJG17_00370, partial [Eubacterium sp.]|nr:hypothetical protein [Eubacterium sp.]
TRKCDIRNILLHFFSCHAKTVIDKAQGLCLVVNDDVYCRLIIIRQMLLADRIQLSAFRNCITRIRNQFSYKNVLIGLHPFFNNRKNVFAVN